MRAIRRVLPPFHAPDSGQALSNLTEDLVSRFGASIKFSYQAMIFKADEILSDAAVEHIFFSGGGHWRKSLLSRPEVVTLTNDWREISFEIRTDWTDSQAQANGWTQIGSITWADTLRNVQFNEFIGGVGYVGDPVIVGIDEVRVESASQPDLVDIDIKPGSDPNSINLGSNGNVPVAILSSTSFDAATIDPLTVTLADASVRVRGNGSPQASQEDVNNDGLLDLVVHIDTQGLALTEGDVTATLSGETTSGEAIEGTDSVRVIAALLGDGYGDALADPLSAESLNKITEFALANLEGEFTSSIPSSIDVVVADLPSGVLGIAELLPPAGSESRGRITLDANANGVGWFVDATPFESSEFGLHQGDSLLAIPGSVASGRYDVITVLSHELGHLYGLGHQHEGIMAPKLPPGVRRLGEHDQALASSNQLFASSENVFGDLQTGKAFWDGLLDDFGEIDDSDILDPLVFVDEKAVRLKSYRLSVRAMDEAITNLEDEEDLEMLILLQRGLVEELNPDTRP